MTLYTVKMSWFTENNSNYMKEISNVVSNLKTIISCSYQISKSTLFLVCTASMDIYKVCSGKKK